MYVLEGSTMGGRILAEKIPQLFAGTQFAACVSYFSAYGEANAERWAEYCRFLDAFGETRPDLLPEVIGGACAAFVAMREVLDADQS